MPEGRTHTLTLTVEALADLDRLDVFLRPISPPAADRFQDVIWEAFNALLPPQDRRPTCPQLMQSPRPGGRADSQDRMDLFIMVAERG